MVLLAEHLDFQKAVECQGTLFTCPKEIADVRGIGYSYSLLWRFSVIMIPQQIENKKEDRNQMIQSSSLRPGTRLNSSMLCVITVIPLDTP